MRKITEASNMLQIFKSLIKVNPYTGDISLGDPSSGKKFYATGKTIVEAKLRNPMMSLLSSQDRRSDATNGA